MQYDETRQLDARPSVCLCCGGELSEVGDCHCSLAVDRFTRAMRRELEANAHKGGRSGDRGWISSMTPEKRVSELLYHVAKLAYAQRQYLQGDGTSEQVVEFAADVGNCALMVADGLGLLGVGEP